MSKIVQTVRLCNGRLCTPWLISYTGWASVTRRWNGSALPRRFSEFWGGKFTLLHITWIVLLHNIILAIFAIVIPKVDSLDLSSHYCVSHGMSGSWCWGDSAGVTHFPALIKPLPTWLDSYCFPGIFISVVKKESKPFHTCVCALLLSSRQPVSPESNDCAG